LTLPSSGVAMERLTSSRVRITLIPFSVVTFSQFSPVSQIQRLLLFLSNDPDDDVRVCP
jgi:hypothetical protein